MNHNVIEDLIGYFCRDLTRYMMILYLFSMFFNSQKIYEWLPFKWLIKLEEFWSLSTKDQLHCHGLFYKSYKF